MNTRIKNTVKILVIADPQIPVPPVGYGGAERIIACLCTGLQRLGHVVDLVAGPGSQSFGGKLWIHHAPTKEYWNRAWRKAIFQPLSLLATRHADLVINHGRPDYLVSLLRTTKRMVHVFHNPIQQSEIDWLLAQRRTRIKLIGVSHSQINGLNHANLLSVVHNATDVERLRFCGQPAADAYLAFLGRLTSNKGVDTAIRVARRAGMRLKIAGNVSDEPGGREFFEREIRPHLDDQVEWIGIVNDAQKQELLGGASALLFPIRWAEPCAVVTSESLACGTPIIASRCASTPELIEDGQTGFLCDSEDDMVAAVARIGELDRAACRRVAEDRFSVSVMTQGYLRVIERLLGRHD